MCLHRGVHGQEAALEESAECGGSHFSHLIKQTRRSGELRIQVRSAGSQHAHRPRSMIPWRAFQLPNIQLCIKNYFFLNEILWDKGRSHCKDRKAQVGFKGQTKMATSIHLLCLYSIPLILILLHSGCYRHSNRLLQPVVSIATAREPEGEERSWESGGECWITTVELKDSKSAS